MEYWASAYAPLAMPREGERWPDIRCIDVLGAVT